MEVKELSPAELQTLLKQARLERRVFRLPVADAVEFEHVDAAPAPTTQPE